MKQMTPAAVERAMKLQDVMLRAMAKRITWYQAAEILVWHPLATASGSVPAR